MSENQDLTIIAPGESHLLINDRIHQQIGNNTGIQVLSLDTFISSQLENRRTGNLPILYRYRKALADLPEENAFKNSADDYDFLRECLSFMGRVFLYDIREFPEETTQQKDLKAVIDRLKEIPLWQQEARTLEFDPQQMEQTWILDREYPLESQYFIGKMVRAGAHLVSGQKQKHKYYWAASNPRTQMEIVAEAILAQDLKAEDVFVALSRPEDARVLSQVFTSRKIPFTLLNKNAYSPVLKQWKAVLHYLGEKTPENLLQVLRELYPASSKMLRQYMEAFPEGSRLENIAYIPNSIISQSEFERFQDLEAQAEPWNLILEEIENWDHTSMEAIAARIQEANPTPSEEDIRVFDGVIKAYASVMDQIQSAEDLKLLERHLDSLYPSSAPDSIEGVLVGTRDQISPLQKNVFYTGADAAHYPGASLHGGVFDEDYMAFISEHSGYPSLSERLARQRENLDKTLGMPENLFVIYPQADYEGKSNEASFDMFEYIGAHPKFQPYYDASVNVKPDFSLSEDVSSQLFFKDRILHANVRSMNAYERCPLQHMLRYGMNLKTPFSIDEQLSVRADILKDILESAEFVYHKPAFLCTREEVEFLVRKQFEFAGQVFVHRRQALEILEKEYADKIMDLFGTLSPLCRELDASLVPQEYQIQSAEQVDGVQVEISGSINSASRNRTPFSLYARNPEENPAGAPGPLASFDFSLKPSPVPREAFKISYGRGSQPVNARHLDAGDASLAYTQNFLKKSVAGQNMPESEQPQADYIRKKTPTYEERIEETRKAAYSLIENLKTGCVLPLHQKGACQHCAYRSVCRNGAQERSS